MKSLRLCLVGFICFIWSTAPGLAQSASDSSRGNAGQRHFHFGAGVSVEPALFSVQDVYIDLGDSYIRGIQPPEYASAPVNVYLAISLTDRLRLEPVLGYYTYKNAETTHRPANGFSPATNYGTTDRLSLFHIGVRLHLLCPVTEHLQVYLGPQGGYFVQKSGTKSWSDGGGDYSSERTTTTPAYLLGGSFGGEYFPVAAFSVGGEIALRYIWYGNPESTGYVYPPGTTELDRQFFTTGALFFVRWYFL